MGIPGELMVAVEAAEVEAKQHLAGPVTALLRKALQLLEPGAFDVLADQHPLAREAAEHLGNHDERMATEDPGERALVLGLELVVELLLDPVPDLRADRLRVQPGRDPLREPQDQPEILHVGANGRGHARILDLDRDPTPVREPRAIHLADRGGGDRFLVELVEHVLDAFLELLLDHLAHVLEGDRRRGITQRCELALKLGPVLLGHEADVDERHHLSELHCRALHLSERLDDLLRRFDVTPLEGGLAPRLGARYVGRVRPRLTDRLSCCEPSDPGGTPHAGGGDLVCHRSSDASRRAPQRCTRDPGTMSSEPSGHRTHALCPPS